MHRQGTVDGFTISGSLHTNRLLRVDNGGRTRALDPYVKADVLAELNALRIRGAGFWSDDKAM
jgi:hypothetical protein